MESMCGCLATRAEAALRRAAVRALTRLLLAGYLRLRTPLYYRYVHLYQRSSALTTKLYVLIELHRNSYTLVTTYLCCCVTLKFYTFSK